MRAEESAQGDRDGLLAVEDEAQHRGAQRARAIRRVDAQAQLGHGARPAPGADAVRESARPRAQPSTGGT